MYDIIVIGAGPIGSSVASIVAKNGYDVLIIEEHREIGRPVQCAGLVSKRVLELAKVNKCILNKIKGAEFFSPKGHKIKVESKKTKAVVIDRAIFDMEIAKNAVRNGAEIELGKRVRAIKKNKNIEVKVGGKIKKCKILIGADGANSTVRKNFNFPKPKKILIGFQKEVVGLELNKEFIQCYISNRFAPNFFAWIIPIKESALIGLCIQNGNSSAHHYLEKFCKKFKNLKTVRYMAGHIPIGALNITCKENIMLVGDSACQVKPVSGGGLYTGLICAKECAKVTVKALENENFSKRVLDEYQKNWQKKIGKELRNGMRLRKILYSLNEIKIEKLFQILDNPKLLKIVEEIGDIDYPSKLLLPMFKKSPKLIKFAPQALNSLI